MRIAAETLPGSTLRGDVAIVGAGPAGLVIALRLAQAGRSVILLESGGAGRNAKANSLASGKSSGYPFRLSGSRRRGFGGTSALWESTTGLRVRPLDSIDLEPNESLGLPGWPVTSHELDRYYARAMEVLGLPFDFESTHWEDDPETPLAQNHRTFLFGPHNHFLEMLKPVAAHHRITLVLDATVVEVRTSESARSCRDLVVATADGKRFVVEAGHVVLAGGGIENPRILLASSSQQPEGVANNNGLVGQYFMDHISADVGFIRPSVDDRNRVFGAFHERMHPSGVKLQSMFGNDFKEVRERRLLNAAFWIAPVPEEESSPGVRSARALRYEVTARPFQLRSLKRIGAVTLHSRDIVRYARHRMGATVPHSGTYAVRVMAEQAPNARSRVTLDKSRDALGIPRVKLDWQLTTADLRSVQSHLDLLDRRLSESSCGRLDRTIDSDRVPTTYVANHHHLGTTRMHKDPRLGVVADDCRTHQIPNLFIVGGSVFPQGGYVNPTLTILALSLRVADALLAESHSISVS